MKTVTERVAESRAAQGLPPKITDPRVLAAAAAIAAPTPATRPQN